MKAVWTKHGKDALKALNYAAFLVASGAALGYGIGAGLFLSIKLLVL